MKNTRAKRAKPQFFIAKYANLRRSRGRRHRGCLSSVLRLFDKRVQQWERFFQLQHFSLSMITGSQRSFCWLMPDTATALVTGQNLRHQDHRENNSLRGCKKPNRVELIVRFE